jgi:metallo-beta-lactamase family protein
MEITFLGAARTVTGSKFLLSDGEQRVLVDCGLFQGLKRLRQRNWQSLPVDHSGYLPALVRDGFRGPIYCTPPSEDLLPILLTDSGRLQEEDAAYANRKGFSKHRPALPLYTEDDAKRVAKRLEAVGYHTDVDLGSWTLSFEPAGHILGAASLTIARDSTRFLFSGDLGRDDAPLIPPPEIPPSADWIVMEGTYGSRNHPDADLEENLGEVARRTLGRGRKRSCTPSTSSSTAESYRRCRSTSTARWRSTSPSCTCATKPTIGSPSRSAVRRSAGCVW